MRIQTCTRHALAWNRYIFWGRVRPWEGIVVIISTPLRPGQGEGSLAAQVFRGYVVVGRYLVGLWRFLGLRFEEGSAALEGPFVAARVEA